MRPIKHLATVFLSLFLLLSLYVPLQAETLVFSTMNYPPYEIAEPEDGLRGTDVEVIEAVFKRFQISTEFKFLPWKRALEMTKLGQFPGIFSCGYSLERAETLIFSEPLASSTDGYFVRRDFDGFEPSNYEEDAKGLKVGSVLGWWQAKAMEEAGADVVTYRSQELTFRDLLKGLIDYAAMTLEGSQFWAKKFGISGEVRYLPTKKKSIYLCFSKKWPGIEEIVRKFNEGLAAVRADGTYDAIHAKYK